MVNKAVWQTAGAFGLLGFFLAVSLLFSLGIGPADISWSDIIGLLYYNVCRSESPAAQALLSSSASDIIFDLRLPRVIMAALGGASLALGGVVMQAVIRNPLADPYILGVSSGAAMGATVSIILGSFSFFGIYGVSAGAFIGAVAVTFLAFAVTFSLGGGKSMTKLILTGMALNAVCGASTSLIVYLGRDAEGIRDVSFWIMGSLSRVSWDTLGPNVIIFLVSAGYLFSQFRVLNASLLGDEMAVILGVRLEKKRRIYLILVAVLISSVVAAVGIIGFVGLVIPHIIRIVSGNNHLRLIPLSILSGGIYLTWCDIFARTALANTEIPIGILTSFVGGPFFLYLLTSKKYGYGER